MWFPGNCNKDIANIKAATAGAAAEEVFMTSISPSDVEGQQFNRFYTSQVEKGIGMIRVLAVVVSGLAIIGIGGRPLPVLAAEDHVSVRSPENLPARLSAERIPLGVPDDYKPCIAKLKNGDLLVIAFHQHVLEGGAIREDAVMFRSRDGGRTWSERTTLPLVGREPYFSVTKEGTLLITVHLLKQDVRNKLGYVHSYLHRSTDNGDTWQTTPISAGDVPGAPKTAWTHTSRNVLPLRDGTLILGVSAPGGRDYLWRSGDDGKSWDRSLACTFAGVDESKLWWPFMAETVFWQAPNGDLLGIFRVDQKVFAPIPGTEIPKEKSDQYERMIVFRSRDGGRNWKLDRPLGSFYGEMYPAILRLAGGKLLLTFTVREVRRPLGVHAVFGVERKGGFEFDFQNDRVVIDDRTPEAVDSGGGFGPTVQIADGTLVTALSHRDEKGKTHLEIVRWRVP